ncbi:MAG TPA: TlpA disulfide reductase family protein [Desertimonas sp.]|nr:TlpA disulfide reductase family protein [Desertimonas sp.]
MAPPQRGNDPARTLLLIAALVAVVAVIGVVVVLVVGTGGDDDEDTTSSVEPFRPVTVTGDPLPEFTSEIRAGDIDDPAVGQPVPVVAGTDYDGNEITIDPATDGPTMVVLLAHWCPHCNAEIPVLNEWRDSGGVPDGLNIVGVSTGASPDAPNYPPDEWLVDMDWQWPVLADDVPPADGAPPPAMAAYGGTSYPTMVFVDSDGTVVERVSGEIPIDVIASIVDDLVASSST